MPPEVVQRTVDRLNGMAMKYFITAYKSLPDDPVSRPVSQSGGRAGGRAGGVGRRKYPDREGGCAGWC